MAEPATQSPFISSSAGGGSSEPGGRDLKGAGSPQPCADSFVSSSQPVSLFSTSQAGAQAAFLAYSGNQRERNGKSAPSDVGKEFVDGQSQEHIYGTSEGLGAGPVSVGSTGLEESSLSVESKVHICDPVVQASSLTHNDFKGGVALDGKVDLSKCDQHKKPASNGESKLALLTNPKDEPEHSPPIVASSHSPTSPVVAGEAVVEKDSPESPFEVIADRLEFDKEFKDVLTSNSNDISSNWVMHSERELLTDIPEDSVCEFRVKPRGGSRIPSGPGLSRQSSGTTAALEEVSKCVRDLHSFTSELLNWDLIPKDLEDKPDDFGSSGFLPSPTRDSDGVAARSVGGKVEASKTSSPHQPLKISIHQKDSPSPVEKDEKQAIVGREVSVVKVISTAAAEPKADVRWPNSSLPEMADADSSGESDDTVIEDATVIPSSQKKTAAESSKPLPKARVHIDDKGSKPRKPSPEGAIPSKALECSWGSIDDFEAIQTKTNVHGGSPVAAPLPAKQPSPGIPPKAGQELCTYEQDLLGTRPRMDRLPLDNVKEAVCPDSLNGESFMGLKSKGSESPDDAVETFSEAELKAARSEVAAPHSQQPPKVTQDFEQEHLTIKALKEVGRKVETERQPLPPSKVSLPGGRRPGQYCEMPPDPRGPVQKSALEKRPLCLEQAVDVKLASAPAALGIPNKSSQAPLPEPPMPHAIAKLLAEFSVRDLVFWRDVKKTGVVFSTTLILLLSLAAFSVISVISYLILALLSITISFRVYKSVIQAVQKSEEGHPFKAYLDVDVALSSEAFNKYVSDAMGHINHALKLIMRLFLVEDLVDSLKLAVVMWLMTYVGAIFNGITLLILAELLVFSVPVVYEKYKTQIDHYVGIAREQIKSVVTKIQAKLPGVVKKKAE
ncbi:reticulon-3 isoform X1 [Zootoca vivipara]|uniref:reticulon-3 isoform X1 n=1 Tax=Zootoca vivipara TaxID=8524 RepID=UPI00293BE7D8|nr:reticulon-3 isoform X1 [Zootoca vivipara]